MLLEEQDRSLWDRNWSSAASLTSRVPRRGETLSRYHAEAGIAAEHCLAPSYAETNWEQIVRLYDVLERIAPSPLNRLESCDCARRVARARRGARRARCDRGAELATGLLSVGCNARRASSQARRSRSRAMRTRSAPLRPRRRILRKRCSNGASRKCSPRKHSSRRELRPAQKSERGVRRTADSNIELKHRRRSRPLAWGTWV